MNLVVKTQAEWDALPTRFAEFTVVEIRSTDRITIRSVPESSRVEAWGSSRVEAWASSRVVAWGSSSVEAWASSRVVARGCAITHHRSSVAPELHHQAVCFRYPKTPAPKKKSDDCSVIAVKVRKGVASWLEREGIVEVDGSVILYKRVSEQFQTQERTANETTWSIGSTLTHPAWEPKSGELGAGKYHACSRTYFCDEFRSALKDRYIAISVRLRDLYVTENACYPHKVAFRVGRVLYEVDRWGTVQR